MIDGRIARGGQTRSVVLEAAVALASVDGLEAMSLARLADAAGVSKSGLFAHWPDKEILQLAVIEHAVRQWLDEIVTPALSAPRGIRRLWALHERCQAAASSWRPKQSSTTARDRCATRSRRPSGTGTA